MQTSNPRKKPRYRIRGPRDSDARLHLAMADPIGPTGEEISFDDMVRQGTRALLVAICRHHPYIFEGVGNWRKSPIQFLSKTKTAKG